MVVVQSKKKQLLTFNHKTILNFHIFYEINLLVLTQTLIFRFVFCDVDLEKKIDPDKYSDSGYGIGSDTGLWFSLSVG